MGRVTFIDTTFPFFYVSVMKKNVNLVTFIRETERVRIVNALFKNKLHVLTMELTALLKNILTYALFSRNSQSNCYSALL